MFDIGWSELIVIGVVALIVVGPKDLPGLFRTVGQYVNRARSMAREFQRNMEEAARDAGMDDVTKAARSVQDIGRVVKSPAASLAQFGADRTRTYLQGATVPGPGGATPAAPAAAAATPVAPQAAAAPATPAAPAAASPAVPAAPAPPAV